MDEVKKPLVSILMSVYNEKDWIEKSVESILNQTYSNFEFIIVNDGSMDNTLSILKKFEISDKRIKIINQKNTGLTKALNNGLKVCKGKYIARMDADNISDLERLKKQVIFLENNLDHVLVGSWREDIFVDSNDKRILKLPIEDIEIKNGLMKACVISHSSVMIRAKEFKKERYDENFRTSQDYELWSRLGKKLKYHNIPEVLTIAYNRPSSITRTKKKLKRLKYHIIIKYKIYKNLKTPMWSIIYIVKPIIEFILPQKLILTYVNWKLKK